jgi:hypothetical protein
VIDDAETLTIFAAMCLVSLLYGALTFVAGVFFGWAL